MQLSNLLTPWLMLAAVLVPLVYAEKWIHSHLYGVGWLLTNDKNGATKLYYLALLPGVLVHEVVQWLVAGALSVPIKRIRAWPEPQSDGTLRLDFVQIKETNWLRSAIIGGTPLIVGLALIWYISNRVLDLENLLSALGTGDLTLIGAALHKLGSTPDFYLWLYVMFAVSNAMLPTPADRKGWPLIIAIFAGCFGFLVLIGVGQALIETFTGPVAHAVDLVTAAFSTVLALELFAIVMIGFTEEVLEKATGRKFEYTRRPARTAHVREPGSSQPLPADVPLPSIYNLNLPLPDPAEHDALLNKARRKAAAVRTAQSPVEEAGADRPALRAAEPGPLTGERPQVAGARPGSSEMPPRVPGAVPAVAAGSELERHPVGIRPVAERSPDTLRQSETGAGGLRRPLGREDGANVEPGMPGYERHPVGTRPMAERSPDTLRQAEAGAGGLRRPLGREDDEEEPEAPDLDRRLSGIRSPAEHPPTALRRSDSPLARPARSPFALDSDADDAEDEGDDVEYVDLDEL